MGVVCRDAHGRPVPLYFTDGTYYTTMEHEDHRFSEVNSAMVTHSISDPVFLFPRGLCSMFSNASSWGQLIMVLGLCQPLSLSLSLQEGLIGGSYDTPQGEQRSQTRSDFMKPALSVWPT